MLSMAGFGIREIDAEFKYVTERVVGKSSRSTCNMQVPDQDVAYQHFRLPHTSERNSRAPDPTVSLQISLRREP